MRLAISFCVGAIIAAFLVHEFSHAGRTGRYQIQPARVLFGSETFDRLFRIDTASGKTWTLNTRTDGKDYWWPVNEPEAEPK